MSLYEWQGRMRHCFVSEEALLWAASDTCHFTNGQGVRGVVSSIFWRFFESIGFLYRFELEVLLFTKISERVFGFFYFSVSV